MGALFFLVALLEGGSDRLEYFDDRDFMRTFLDICGLLDGNWKGA